MTGINVEATIKAMAHQLSEVQVDEKGEPALIIGIRTGGVWVAQRLKTLMGYKGEIGELDISFYRDDFTRIGLNPKVKPSHLPFSIDGRDIILVDDVIMSGRTIRAAMNELFDYGRPSRISLATLVDIPKRELPIQADVVGVQLAHDATLRVKLTGPESLALEYVSSTAQ